MTTALILLNMAVLLIVVWLLAYKKGYQDATFNKPEKPVYKPEFKAKYKETEEEKRQRILSENIENYDGSGRGQVKL